MNELEENELEESELKERHGKNKIERGQILTRFGGEWWRECQDKKTGVSKISSRRTVFA